MGKISNGSANQTGSISYIGLSPIKIRTEQVQKPQELAHFGANDRGICRLCSSNSSLFDAEIDETVCTQCGMVVHENTDSLGPEWRTYSDDIESKSRTGMPSSLAFHDMGLSTFISFKCGRERCGDQPWTDGQNSENETLEHDIEQ